MDNFDVVVIGSGPGGYVSAIRCAQLGFKTAIVEKYNTLGGTCLNVGCIPSKAWLDSSEKFHELNHSFEDHGIEAKSVKLNMKKMSSRVADVVSGICGGVDYLMKKNKITVITGHGSFKDDKTLTVTNDNVSKDVSSKRFIIATGSKPATLPGIEIDKKRVITSTEALKMETLPKSLVVIGGGVIGLEMGSVFSRLGSQVSVVEYAPSIIAGMDADLGKELQKVLKKKGMDFYTNHAVQSAVSDGTKVKIVAKSNKNAKEVIFESEYCLVAVGRRPYTHSLGLENIGITLDERGRIPTNDHKQTTHSHIYAIGDVTAGAMLAHKAEEEGVYVAEHMKGEKPHINYNLIPGVVYTWPEVAAVGLTEKQLKDQGIKAKKGVFPFKASGRAKASNESDGFIKVLAHPETDEILGVHMIGPRCADLITEAVVAMEYKASAEDIARICHAHPTYSESFKEAALAATENRAIHI